MPRVFVPGPSVNVNFGSPATYLKNLQDTIKGFHTRGVDKERAESLKLFRDETLKQAADKQAFAEGEPDRKRAEKLFERTQLNLRAREQQAAIESSGFRKIDTFLANPVTQEDFAKRGITDPDAQRAEVTAFAKKNKKLFSDPNVIGDQAYKKIIEGNGTLAEANAARTAAINSEFTSLDSDLAKALLIKHGSGGSASSVGKLLTGTSGKSGSLLQGIPSQLDTEKLRDITTSRINIEGDRGNFIDSLLGSYVGNPEQDFLDFGDKDLDQANIDTLVGEFGTDFRNESILGALRSISDPKDGTIPQDTWRDLQDSESTIYKDFKTNAQKFETKANEARGVTGGTPGITGVDDLIKFQKAQFDRINAHNRDIISRTAASANTFEERLAAFRSSLGQPSSATAPLDTPPTCGQGDDTAVVPKIAPGGDFDDVNADNSAVPDTGSAGLNELLSAPQTVPAPADNRIFTGNPNVGGAGPAALLAERAAETAATEASEAEAAATAQASKVGDDQRKTAKAREEKEIADNANDNRISARISSMSKSERKIWLDRAKKALKSGEISSFDLTGMRGNHDDNLIELLIRRQ